MKQTKYPCFIYVRYKLKGQAAELPVVANHKAVEEGAADDARSGPVGGTGVLPSVFSSAGGVPGTQKAVHQGEGCWFASQFRTTEEALQQPGIGSRYSTLNLWTGLDF